MKNITPNNTTPNNTTPNYTFEFNAVFYNGKFNSVLLKQQVPVAERMFNALTRKNRKILKVSVDTEKNQLNFKLKSTINIDSVNYLRSCQYFSKCLSTLSGMNAFIVGKHLLIQA